MRAGKVTDDLPPPKQKPNNKTCIEFSYSFAKGMMTLACCLLLRVFQTWEEEIFL